MSDAASKLVVIDAGSWTTKAGLAGDDKPRGIIPTLAGTDSQSGSVCVGQAVQDAYDKLDARCPMEDGYIVGWDDAERIWSHVFKNILSVDPASCNVLLTDSSTNSISNREKMAQVMFEKIKVGGLFIAKQSVLGMYSTGRVTGLVVDSGHVTTHVVPVYEGFCVGDCIEKVSIGGQAVSDYIIKSLQNKGIHFPSKSYSLFEVAKLKESLCKVADNFQVAIRTAPTQEYVLPDGKKVSVGKESLEAAELLFQPQLVDQTTEQRPLHKVIQTCIGKCEIDARAPLTSAITLIGGNTMLAGFPERVAKEVTSLMGSNVKIISNSQRALYTWIGGSVLASLPQTNWISNNDYVEEGSSVVRKFP